MSTAKVMNSFVKQFIAVIKGDDAEATAQKVWRQANSALTSQISSMKGDLIGKEDKVIEAKEALSLARVNNGKSISDRNKYIQDLTNAKNKLTEAEKELNNFNNLIKFLEDELSSLSKEEK